VLFLKKLTINLIQNLQINKNITYKINNIKNKLHKIMSTNKNKSVESFVEKVVEVNILQTTSTTVITLNNFFKNGVNDTNEKIIPRQNQSTGNSGKKIFIEFILVVKICLKEI
jgi:hypothetical protein